MKSMQDSKSVTTTEESAGDMLVRLGVDAQKWAQEFRQIAIKLGYSDMDEGWLIGWFANAMMAMHDYGRGPINGDHAQFLIDQARGDGVDNADMSNSLG
jgi:hypothetical protein